MLAFYLLLPFLYLFSILPFRVLYGISDVLIYPILNGVVKYRKAVILKNLQNSFPNKTQQELKHIQKEYYAFLADLMVEVLKMFTISKKEFQKRFVADPLPKEIPSNQNVVLTLGHYGNYEWLALALGFLFEQVGSGPYKTMTNPYFDAFFLKKRKRFGAVLFSTKETGSFLRQKHEKAWLITLANDQAAPPDKAHWVNFLNQETSFFAGTESISRKYNCPVIFANIKRMKRGYYKMELQTICLNPSEIEPGFIIQRHAELLEKSIIEEPAYWLWSHKRWKFKKPEKV